MLKILRNLVAMMAVLAFSTSAQAQSIRPQQGGTGCSSPATALPTGVSTGTLCTLTNGTLVGDAATCTPGGSAVVTCRYNGATWDAVTTEDIDSTGGGGTTAVWGRLSSNSSAGSDPTKYTGWGADADSAPTSSACVVASSTNNNIQILGALTGCPGVYTAHLTGSIQVGEEATHQVTLRVGTGTPAVIQTVGLSTGRDNTGGIQFALNWVFAVGSGSTFSVQMGNSGGGSPVGGSMVLSVVRIGS